MSIDLRSGRSAAIDALAGASENTNRNGFDDFVLIFPKVELREIVRAHEPCEARKREFVTQRAKGFSGVACVQLGFDVGDVHAGMPHNIFGACCAHVHWRRSALFKRVSGGNEPPDLIQIEPFQRL
jgi:hypothetical protein